MNVYNRLPHIVFENIQKMNFEDLLQLCRTKIIEEGELPTHNDMLLIKGLILQQRIFNNKDKCIRRLLQLYALKDMPKRSGFSACQNAAPKDELEREIESIITKMNTLDLDFEIPEEKRSSIQSAQSFCFESNVSK